MFSFLSLCSFNIIHLTASISISLFYAFPFIIYSSRVIFPTFSLIHGLLKGLLVDWRNKASETSIIQQGLELPSTPITSTETLRVQRDVAVYSSCQSFLCTTLHARFSVNIQVFSFRVPFKGTSFFISICGNVVQYEAYARYVFSFLYDSYYVVYYLHLI
jgi:hypothetical protein